MTIGRVRSLLYAVARFLGDVSAVIHHRIWKRIRRRVLGRLAGRAIGGLVK